MTSYEDYDYECKLVFLGDTGVGKTSLIKRYSDNIFEYNITSSKGAFHYEKIIRTSKKLYKVYIWDTTGEERFKSMLSFYYRDAQMVALVYSTVAPETVENLRFWIEEVQEKNNRKCVILLIGNKIDLDPEHSDDDIPANIRKLCEEYKIGHLYTSAKDDVNVDSIFSKLVNEAEENHVIENSSIGCHTRSLVANSKNKTSGCSC